MLLIYVPVLSSVAVEVPGFETIDQDGVPVAPDPVVSTLKYALLWTPTARRPVDIFHAGAAAPFTGGVMLFNDLPILLTWMFCAAAVNIGTTSRATRNKTRHVETIRLMVVLTFL